jgi:hypothetical protein
MGVTAMLTFMKLANCMVSEAEEALCFKTADAERQMNAGSFMEQPILQSRFVPDAIPKFTRE